MVGLKPKLDYRYSIKDALIALSSFFYKKIDLTVLSGIFGNNNIYFVNHARTGLRIALNSLGLKKGSRVGVQAFNCFTVFNAVRNAGYYPVFIDINDGFQIDLNDVERKKNKIDALIVTHLFGIPADMFSLQKILQDIPIIEDCAHALLSKYNGLPLGTIGDIGVFSMGKGKFPSIGSGGFIISKVEYAKMVETEVSNLKNNSIFDELFSIFTNLILSFLHHSVIYRFLTQPHLKKLDKKNDFLGKFKSDERKILISNKYLFLNKMMNIKSLLKHRINTGENYARRFNVSQSLSDIIVNPLYKLNYFMLPVLFPSDKDSLILQLRWEGIEVAPHFKNSIVWAVSFGYEIGQCKNSEKIANEIIVIPTYK
jgi:perosamine synthetase